MHPRSKQTKSLPLSAKIIGYLACYKEKAWRSNAKSLSRWRWNMVSVNRGNVWSINSTERIWIRMDILLNTTSTTCWRIKSIGNSDFYPFCLRSKHAHLWALSIIDLKYHTIYHIKITDRPKWREDPRRSAKSKAWVVALRKPAMLGNRRQFAGELLTGNG